jgi:hypothetical protein
VLVASALTACHTTSGTTVVPPADLMEARDQLFGPPPGDMAALYKLRVRATGGLRLTVLTLSDEGRVGISEPFGSAVSLTAWRGLEPPEVFDLRERCRFTTNDLSGVLGVSNLPLPQAIRILAGRLPALEGDRIDVTTDGRLRVSGASWSGLVTVEPDPWRVVAVEDVTAGDGEGWRVEIRDHSVSIPGWMRVKGADGRWAELELTRLQWNTTDELPPVPDIEVCGQACGRTAGPERSGRTGNDP